MSHYRIRINFPEDKITEPIIYQLGREFNVVTNVRRADVREKTGWVELELEGDSAEIEKAVESLRAKGVKVEPIERNIIE
ncbi:MAG: NIL domain-containing protein [Nitrospirae bacterium]|nr:NIL domain-containing protein [Nitrospirota bacterium]